MKISFLFLVVGIGIQSLHAASEAEIESLAGREAGSLLRLYTHLHSNPELSLREVNTAERIGKELENAGFVVTRNVGGHGLVGVLKNGDGPVVMVRTDLDGLITIRSDGRRLAVYTHNGFLSE